MLLCIKSFLQIMQENEDDCENKITSVSSLKLVGQSAASITHLVLTKLGLTELPAEILTLTCLTKFNFSDNDLSILPKMLEKLPSLEEIIGRNNKIKNSKNDGPYSATIQGISDAVDCIYSDQELEADPIQIEQLDFFHLPSLNNVDLSGNLLEEFPPSLSSSTSLVKLNLSNNLLKCLPIQFSSYPVINHLLLEDNAFSHLLELPLWLFHMQRCTVLSFRNSYLESLIEEIPCDVGSVCRQIIKLDLQNSGIKEFPIGFTGFLDLEILLLGNTNVPVWCENKSKKNSISLLPIQFSNLIGLTHLSACDLSLRQLPDSIGRLTNLTYLDFSKNSLHWISHEFSQLVNLETIDLSFNALLNFTTEMKNFSRLRTLNLSYNQIWTLPEDIGLLPNLKILDAYSNKLYRLPDLGFPQSLTCLDISANFVSRDLLHQTYGKEFLVTYDSLQEALRQLSYTHAQHRQLLIDFLVSTKSDTESNDGQSEEFPKEIGFDDAYDDVAEDNARDLDCSDDVEDWDTFHPTVKPPSEQVLYDAFPSINIDSVFCPADWHKRSYINRKKSREQAEEAHKAPQTPGQFEDAESEDENGTQA